MYCISRETFVAIAACLLLVMASVDCHAARTYIYSVQNGDISGDLKIYELSNNNTFVELSVVVGQNIGEFSGAGVLKGGVLYVDSNDFPECQLAVKLQGKSATVDHKGADFQCGFGRNVHAQATYTFQEVKENDVPPSANRGDTARNNSVVSASNSSKNTNDDKQPASSNSKSSQVGNAKAGKLSDVLTKYAQTKAADIVNECQDKTSLIKTFAELHDMATKVYFAAKNKRLNYDDNLENLKFFVMHYRTYVSCSYDHFKCSGDKNFKEYSELLSFDGSELSNYVNVIIREYKKINDLENASRWEEYLHKGDLMNQNYLSNNGRLGNICR